MKKLVLTLVIVLSFSITNTFAKGVDPVDVAKLKISKVVKEVLTGHKFELSKDVLARITFTLNERGEIVVLKVNCGENTELESYISNALKFKSTKIDNTIYKYKLYTIPVLFKL